MDVVRPAKRGDASVKDIHEDLAKRFPSQPSSEKESLDYGLGFRMATQQQPAAAVSSDLERLVRAQAFHDRIPRPTTRFGTARELERDDVQEELGKSSLSIDDQNAVYMIHDARESGGLRKSQEKFRERLTFANTLDGMQTSARFNQMVVEEIHIQAAKRFCREYIPIFRLIDDLSGNLNLRTNDPEYNRILALDPVAIVSEFIFINFQTNIKLARPGTTGAASPGDPQPRDEQSDVTEGIRLNFVPSRWQPSELLKSLNRLSLREEQLFPGIISLKPFIYGAECPLYFFAPTLVEKWAKKDMRRLAIPRQNVQKDPNGSVTVTYSYRDTPILKKELPKIKVRQLTEETFLKTTAVLLPVVFPSPADPPNIEENVVKSIEGKVREIYKRLTKEQSVDRRVPVIEIAEQTQLRQATVVQPDVYQNGGDWIERVQYINNGQTSITDFPANYLTHDQQAITIAGRMKGFIPSLRKFVDVTNILISNEGDVFDDNTDIDIIVNAGFRTALERAVMHVQSSFEIIRNRAHPLHSTADLYILHRTINKKTFTLKDFIREKVPEFYVEFQMIAATEYEHILQPGNLSASLSKERTRKLMYSRYVLDQKLHVVLDAFKRNGHRINTS